MMIRNESYKNLKSSQIEGFLLWILSNLKTNSVVVLLTQLFNYFRSKELMLSGRSYPSSRAIPSAWLWITMKVFTILVKEHVMSRNYKFHNSEC